MNTAARIMPPPFVSSVRQHDQQQRQLHFVEVHRCAGSGDRRSSYQKAEECRRMVQSYLQLESHPVFYKSYGRLRLLSPLPSTAAPADGIRIGSRRQVYAAPASPSDSFGRKSPGLVRRPNDCLILEPSEMIVIDQSADAFAAFAACPPPTAVPLLRHSSSAGSLELPLALDRVEHSSAFHAAKAHVAAEVHLELPMEPSPPLSSSSRRRLLHGNSTDLPSYKLGSRTSDDTSSSVQSSGSIGDGVCDIDAVGGASGVTNDSLIDSDDEDSYAESGLMPQDTVRDCLEKDPGDRTDDDIEILLDFMHSLPAFTNMTMATRRALCAVMVFAVVEKAGTMVMNDGEELDSWSAILNGKVEITFADGSTETLQMGQSFGIRPTGQKEYHRGIMRTMVDDCQFVCIAQTDYNAILSQGEENTSVLRENGEVVMVTEKRVLDGGARAGTIVIKGTPESLIRHLVEDHSPVDSTYIEDFLLTYRAFLAGPVEVARKLLHWFRSDVQLRARVTRIILSWVRNHFNDFECSMEMTEFLQTFEHLLEAEAMLQQLRVLHLECTEKARVRMVTLTRAVRDEMLHFSIHGGAERSSAIFVTQVERGSKAYEGGLRRGDQILQVNGHSFEGITHLRALEILRGATLLSIMVKSNLRAFYDMLNTPESMHPASPQVCGVSIKVTSAECGSESSLADVADDDGLQQQQCTSNGIMRNRKKVDRGQSERQLSKDSPALSSSSGALTADAGPQSSNKLLKALSKIILKSHGNSSTVRVTGIHGSVSLDTPRSANQQAVDMAVPLAAYHRSNSDPNLKMTMQRSNSSPDIWAGMATSAYGIDDSRGLATLPEHVLKIYCADQTCKYFLVHKETTARDVVILALRQFGISEHSSRLQNVTCNNYSLCEVSAESNGVVKQKRLPDTVCNLAERIGVRSRYYLKNNMSPDSLVPDDAVHDMVKESQFSFLSLSCLELAMQLTMADCALFQRIEPTEYVDDLCLVPSSKSGTANLQKFAELANKEMFWVVNEVCDEQNVYKRVKILKHFIKIARYCKDFRNFNSMFALLSGLGQGSVARLRNTWEKLPNKYQKMFSDLESVMDPTRNMAKYRSLLAAAASQPPVIPLFPLVKKDLAFIHYGNDTWVEGLVNFEKMRMIAKEVRQTCNLSSAQYTADSMLGSTNGGGSVFHGFANTSSQANMSGFVTTRRKKRGGAHIVHPKKMFEEAQMTRRVKAYLSELVVEHDEDKLLELSLRCEASRRNEMSSQSSSISVGGNSGLSSAASPASGAAGSKFGSSSPEAVRKLMLLSEGAKPVHPKQRTQPQALSPMSIQPVAAVHSASTSPNLLPRMSGLSPSGGPYSPSHPRPVDLSSESSSVISVGNVSRKFSTSSTASGQGEGTPGERRRGSHTPAMALVIAGASAITGPHDNDSGHCSFASSSYDAQSMSSMGSASSPPLLQRQAAAAAAAAPVHHGQAVANAPCVAASRAAQHPACVPVPYPEVGARNQAVYAPAKHVTQNISQHERSRSYPQDCYGTDDDEEVISAV